MCNGTNVVKIKTIHGHDSRVRGLRKREQVNYVRTKILVSKKSIIQISTSMFQDLWHIFLIPLGSPQFLIDDLFV